MKINKAYLIILLLALSYAVDCNNRLLRKKFSTKLEGSIPQEKDFKEKSNNLRKMMMDQSVLQKDFVKALTEFKKECDSNPLCKGKVLTDLQVKQMTYDHDNLLLLNILFDEIDLRLKKKKYDEAMEIAIEYFQYVNFYDSELNQNQQVRKRNKKTSIQEACLTVLSDMNNQISQILNDESKTDSDLVRIRKRILNSGFKKKESFYQSFDEDLYAFIKQIRESFPGFIQQKLILKDFSKFENYRTTMLNKIVKESYKYTEWTKEKGNLNDHLKDRVTKYKLLTSEEKEKLIKEYDDFIVQVEEFMKLKRDEKNKKDECERIITAVTFAIHDFYDKAGKPDLTEDDYKNSYNLIKILTTTDNLRKCDRTDIDQRLPEVEQTFQTISARFEEQSIKDKYQEINEMHKQSKKKFFLYNQIIQSELNEDFKSEHIDYALMLNLPPKFCYKRPDAGYIPKKCPAGYERKGVFCIKSCEAIAQQKSLSCKKWKFWGIGCTCNESLSDLQKSFFINYFSQDVLTNFNRGVECDDKQDWKHLALCYKTNCPNFMPGYVNCGMGACAITESVCKWEIGTMVWGTISNLISLLLFIFTMGTSSWAKWLSDGVSPFKNKEIISRSKTLIGILTKIWRLISENDKETQDKIENAIKEGNSWIGSVWAHSERRNTVVQKAVATLNAEIYKNLPDAKKKSLAEAVEQRFSTLGNQRFSILDKIKKAGSEYFGKCKNYVIDSVNDKPENEMRDIMKEECMQTLVSMVSTIDPTGLVGLFVTFNRPNCSDQSAEKNGNNKIR